MSKSHRRSNRSQASESRSSSTGGWSDHASLGNDFMQSLMGGDERASATGDSDLDKMPITEDWLQGEATRIQGASAGGSYVVIEGPQLEFMTLEQARVGTFTAVTQTMSLTGQVFDKPTDKQAKIWFEEDTPDQLKYDLKRNHTIDLFALDG